MILLSCPNSFLLLLHKKYCNPLANCVFLCYTVSNGPAQPIGFCKSDCNHYSAFAIADGKPVDAAHAAGKTAAERFAFAGTVSGLPHFLKLNAYHIKKRG